MSKAWKYSFSFAVAVVAFSLLVVSIAPALMQ
jgi:hypothetical protein